MARKPRVKVKASFSGPPRNFVSIFKKEVLATATQVNDELADAVIKEAKSVIRKQKYNWEPLEEGYRRSKERKGLDTRILMATRHYVNYGIGKWTEGDYIRVGPRRGIHKPSGLRYQYLARIHEFGTEHIPARPLWRPVLSTVLQRRKKYRRSYDAARRRATRVKQQRSIVRA